MERPRPLASEPTSFEEAQTLGPIIDNQLDRLPLDQGHRMRLIDLAMARQWQEVYKDGDVDDDTAIDTAEWLKQYHDNARQELDDYESVSGFNRPTQDSDPR